jgi:hypothetical protein
MKGELLILFVILLLAFILCSFLGGKGCIEGFDSVTNDLSTDSSNDSSNDSSFTSQSNYDNYNHYNKTSSPTIFYGPNGGTAKVIKTLNNNTIVITNKNGTTEIYYIDSNSNDSNISNYYGPNGGSAKLINNNGKQLVEITGPNGSKIVYTSDNNNNHDYDNHQYNQYNNNDHYNNHNQYDNTNGSNYNQFENNNSSLYYNSLPKGISRSQIPSGQEDLYILKSQVVPPVCPKCPNPIVKCPTDTDVTKCPPCPPCARCPEPNFTCAKIPNYSAFNQDTMPVPVLSDFSTFGM